MPNSYWVVPGEFAAGEYPGDHRSVKAEEKVQALLCAGVTQFIDLTEEGERNLAGELVIPYAHLLGEAAAHDRLSIVDMWIPENEQEMVNILDAIDTARDTGKPVYVHCLGGVGRTGTVVGCWLVRHGYTGEEALAQIAEWWKGMEQEKRDRHPFSPQRIEQCNYVRDWREREREPSRA